MDSYSNLNYYGTNVLRIGYEVNQLQIESYLDLAWTIECVIRMVLDFSQIGSESNRLSIGWHLDWVRLHSNH